MQTVKDTDRFTPLAKSAAAGKDAHIHVFPGVLAAQSRLFVPGKEQKLVKYCTEATCESATAFRLKVKTGHESSRHFLAKMVGKSFFQPIKKRINDKPKTIHEYFQKSYKNQAARLQISETTHSMFKPPLPTNGDLPSRHLITN